MNKKRPASPCEHHTEPRMTIVVLCQGVDTRFVMHPGDVRRLSFVAGAAQSTINDPALIEWALSEGIDKLLESICAEEDRELLRKIVAENRERQRSEGVAAS